MSKTPTSLLERLRQPGEQESWERFVDLYTPLIHAWTRQAGVPAEDVADLVQDVLTTLVRKLPEFQYDRNGSFRGWLKTVTRNTWRTRRRVLSIPIDAEGSAALDDLPSSGDAAFSEAEYRRQLAECSLRLIRPEFQPTTWQAAWQTLVAGRPVAEVAAELAISRNAVYIARLRVLRRLHQELSGLLD